MKYLKLVIIISFQLLILQNANSQDTSAVYTGKQKTYHCWLLGDTTFNSRVHKGFVYSVADSGIVFSVSILSNSFYSYERELKFIDAFNIEQLKIRRRGSVGKGIAIGAGVGFLIGAAFGYGGDPDYRILSSLPPGENALAGGVVFSIPGAIIGGIAGSVRVKIPINRNREQYKMQKENIAGYITTEPQ